MIRTAVAALLSLTLAMPAATAPAAAQEGRDLARIAGGLAALYVLKQALDARKDRRAAPDVARAPHYEAPLRRHESRSHRRNDRHVGRGHRSFDRDGRHHRRRDLRVLPERCYVTHRSARGRHSGYGARCMQNVVARPGFLPPQCLATVRTDRGRRSFYGPRCLARQGWSPRTARR